MLRVGLTGAMGSGKSTVASMLEARGAAVVSTDELARQAIAPGSPGHEAVMASFGPGVTSPDGALDRRALAEVVFGSKAKLAALEAIVHPLVKELAEARLAALEGAGVVVIEIPLLNRERAEDYRLARVVLVECKPEAALARAISRGFSAADVAARQASQPGTEERGGLADRVIDNNGGLEELAKAVDDLWDWLQAGAEAG